MTLLKWLRRNDTSEVVVAKIQSNSLNQSQIWRNSFYDGAPAQLPKETADSNG